jgi:hypothetical protein
VNVKKQALTTTEIEMLALATLADLDGRGRLASEEDGQVYLSEPKTLRRATLRWFIDTLAIAGCAMAGVCVGVWLDSPSVDPNSVDAQETE